MIIKLLKTVSNQNLEAIKNKLAQYDCSSESMVTTNHLILGVLGNTAQIDEKLIEELPGVISVTRINAPYKLVSRDYKPTDTIVKVGNIEIGGNNFVIIAGPCSVENEIQLNLTAKYVSKTANILRGGIFKPRTSPYSFQGLGNDGLILMEKAKKDYNIPIICELMSAKQIEKFGSRVDMIQIGARNMQNFDLLKAAGKTTTPILLKRGISATIEEWLMAAEYIMSYGNKNIVLCERGVRSFENAYRNMTDINAIVFIKKLTHLPIIVDPSHSTGKSWMVENIALASVVCKSNGVMIETHYNPEIALSDGPQSLNEAQYETTIAKVNKLYQFMKTLN